MILHYGHGADAYDEDTRDLRHGKYDCGMAKFIADRVLANGDFGDDEIRTGDTEGVIRYGRRLFYWDDRGFEYCDTYPTVADAARRMTEAYRACCEPCPTCGESVHWEDDEHECAADGPLLGEPVTVAGYRGVAWRVTAHYTGNGTVSATMIGDDHPRTFDASDVTVVTEDDYCGGCGQVGCGWGH